MGRKLLGLQFVIEASNSSHYCYKFTFELGLEEKCYLRIFVC